MAGHHPSPALERYEDFDEMRQALNLTTLLLFCYSVKFDAWNMRPHPKVLAIRAPEQVGIPPDTALI